MSSKNYKKLFRVFILGTLSLLGAEGALAYCSSSGSTTYYEWIESVAIGPDWRTSGNNSGYGDFTQNPFYLLAGSNELRLQPGYRGYNYTEYWKVWIDFNKDQAFSDDEAVYSRSSSAPILGSINIPDSVPSGETRMRVSMRYGGSPPACGSITWGEVEDYAVFIDTADTTPPEVATHTPAMGAGQVTVSAPIIIEFTEELDPSSVSADQVILNGPTGQVWGSLNANGSTLTFTPDAPLEYSSSYTVTVFAGLGDLNGNPMVGDYSWSFATELPDLTPPEVLNVFPSAGKKWVNVHRSVQAQFSEALDPATINDASITVTDGYNVVSGAIYHSDAMLTFIPDSLAYSTTYKATLSTELCDLAGNCLSEPYSWTFTTEEWAPGYCASYPSFGGAWAKSVKIGNFTSTYQSQPVDGYHDGTSTVFELSSSFLNNMELTPGFSSTWGYTVFWSVFVDWDNDGDFGDGETVFQGSGNSKVTGQFAVPTWAVSGNTRMRVALSGSGYPPACALSAGFVKDVTVNIPEPWSDTTAPQVLSSSPGDGAQGVAVGQSITADFSEAINAQTLDSASFSITEQGIQVWGEVSYDAQNRRAIFTPAQPLAYGVTYTATLSTAITDVAGNALEAATSWSFSTEAEPVPTVPLSGKVTFEGAGLAGVEISVSDGESSFSVVTADDGSYNVAGIAAGSYTITPVKAGYVFAPESMGVVVEDLALAGLDFTGAILLGALVNGDFETGSFTGFDLYETSNGHAIPEVVSFDTDNDGNSSLAAKFVVGQKSYSAGQYEGGGLSQSVDLVDGDLLVSVDIAATTSSSISNASGGLVEIYLDNQLMDSHDFGNISSNEYAQLSFSLPQVAAGTHTIRIQMTRPYIAGSVSNYLDDIVISGTSTQ